MGGVGGGGGGVSGSLRAALHRQAHWQYSPANVLIAVAQDEHAVDMVVAAYSPPAHAVQVSVAASAYL